MWQDGGYYSGKDDVPTALKHLEGNLEKLPDLFAGFTSEALLAYPAPGKWSKQQVLGHLIDSALNNLKRFSEIPFLPQPHVLQIYQQNELVLSNNYQQLPLEHLLDLWKALNQQIIYTVQNIPAEKLHVVVSASSNTTEHKTLAWLFCDYVAHLEHHLKQV